MRSLGALSSIPLWPSLALAEDGGSRPSNSFADVNLKGANQISSALKYIGPYPCITLAFPHLSTPRQRERDEAGVLLDFVLDTGANTNTINAKVAEDLGLEVVGTSMPGVGAGGRIRPGDTFSLGDARLEGQQEGTDFVKGLTASALPVASPAAAGLLGIFFLDAFPGGIELEWGSDGGGTSPSITFYTDKESMQAQLERKQLVNRVPIKILEGTGLPSITLRVNGVDIPALLDTGSPITVLNSAAAKAAGVSQRIAEKQDRSNGGSNLLSKLSEEFKAAADAGRILQKQTQAIESGDLLFVQGSNRETIPLARSNDTAKLSLGEVEFSDSQVFVGDLPGLMVLSAVGDSVLPGAVVGLDILKSRPRMLYRPDEVFF